MSKSVKDVEITFENIDYIIVPSQYFLDFSFEDIHTEIHRAAINAILRYSVVKSLKFVLKKEVNDVARSLEGDVHCVHYGEDTLFDRIHTHHDITHVKLIYMDDTFEEFAAEWEDDGDDEYRNLLQQTSINEDGNLLVTIQKN